MQLLTLLKNYLDGFTGIMKMKKILSLKEFIRSDAAKKMLPSISSGKAAVEKIGNELSIYESTSSVTLSPSDKEEFCLGLSRLVHTEEFWGKLSEDVGHPRVDESEDEFVNRAKDAMKRLIRLGMRT